MAKNKMNNKKSVRDRKWQPKKSKPPICHSSDMLDSGDYWYCPHCRKEVKKGGE